MTPSPPGGYSNTRVTGCQLQLQLVTIATVLIILFGQVPPNSGQYSKEAPLACRAKYAKFNGNHTACLRPNGCKITHWGVSKAEQRKIVEVHNHYRNLIASGNETQLGFPSASNMLKMEWDPELAYVAQMHANQCKFEHDCYDCRRTDRYEFVGQNLYIYQTTRSSAEIQWPYVIKEWYDEIQIAPPAVAQSFDLFNLNIGHFTQIAWATTNRIGCGYVTYDTSGSGDDESNSIFKTAQLYTCNYAPGGNFLGEKMYEDGNAASRCPARYRRSKRFTSLCEIARANNKNTNSGGQKPNKKANKNKNKNKNKNSSGTSARTTSRRVTTTTVQKISPVRTTTTTFNGENEITGIREQVTPFHSTPLITRFTTTTTTTTNNNNNGGQPLQTESFNFNPSSTTTTTFSNPNNFNTLLTTPNLQLPTSTTLGASTTTVNDGNGDNNPQVNFISDDTPSPSITTTNRREGAERDDGSSLVLLRTTPLITTSINRFPTSTSTTTTTLQARPVSAPPPSPSTSTRTTFTTSTTRRNVARPTSRPPPPPQTSSSTFSLRPFSSRPTLTNNDGISVTATSKRVAPWWDKWSNNFANSISPRRPPPRFSTTRSPWRRWSSGWTTSSNNFRRTTQPVIMRFEMSHNGTTTHSINQIF